MADISTITLPNGSVYNFKDKRITSIASATVSLAANSWSSKSQTATVSGVTSTSILIVSAAPESYSAWLAAGIYASSQGTNTITFTCNEVPTVAISANVLRINLA